MIQRIIWPYQVLPFIMVCLAVILRPVASGTLINNATGSLLKSNAAGIAQVTPNVSFINSGTIKGVGQFTFSNTTSNTGTISPGSSPGSMIVNPGFVSGNPIINMEISTTGAVPGTNYDRLEFSTVSSLVANVTGASLRVTDLASDPIGTVYTLLSFPSGTITGHFASTTLSGSLGNLVYGSNFITVQKTSTLPLTWGNFVAIPENGKVILNWITLQESNTSCFIIEHASDNKPFTAIGTLPAAGNSNVATGYSYTHTLPDVNGHNYYRLQQVDLDARSSYSATRMVQFDHENAKAILLHPNPVHDMLQATVYESDIQITINTPNGKTVRRLYLEKGIN